jgi:hypothetical protein
LEADPEHHTLQAVFSTGERRLYDVTPLLERGVFRSLRDTAAFAAVRIDDLGGVAWESGPDLSRDTIYMDGEPV